MASRQKGFGLTAEINRKMALKYDPDQALVAMNWIQTHVPDAGTKDIQLHDDVFAILKSGVIVCKLMNALQPGSIKKINQSTMAFKQMESISVFLDAAEAYGVHKSDSFQTVDLFEGQNISAVINMIHALGRKANAKKKGTGIGPKESEVNKREFSEEQLRAGEGVIGLQMGSNKGATQAGQNFGKTRAIID